MRNESMQAIFDYHKATKHHFQKFAKSLGYLDWANQPEPFRTFEGAPPTAFPLLENDPKAMHLGLYCRKNNAEKPFSFSNIAGFMELSMGLSAWKSIPGSRWSLRINPSSGNLHPTEAYLVLPETDRSQAGVYHYNPLIHTIELRAEVSSQLWRKIEKYCGSPGFLTVLTSIYWRESWKYGERAFRYCHHDVGHALACICFSANLFGWKMLCFSGLSDKDIGIMLGSEKTPWPEHEQEHPDLLCYVFPASKNMTRKELSQEILNDFEKLEFLGLPNRLSRRHHPWEIIENAGENSQKPPTEPSDFSFETSPLSKESASKFSASEIIRKRRSAVAFDRNGALSEETFFSILDKTLPRKNTAPFDIELSPPRIHLLIFVHNVLGLDQGLYFFFRNAEDVEPVRSISHGKFLWETVKENFPLFFLEGGNFRSLAAKVSCYQDIAGESVFSLGMIARFRECIEMGPYNYKNLFWESGMIGQVLYLEAEAHGARGTGIGCYFDDPVHDVMGFPDNRYQSLYHFTVGKPVPDRRLKTLPPYYHLERRKGR